MSSAAASASPAAAASAAPAASPAKPGTATGPRTPAKTTKTNGKGAAAAPVEEEKPIVFKGSSRAKKVFKLFDGDKDKFLNRAEFEDGLGGFVNGPGLEPLTKEQLDALWLETDLNKDEKISWAEFNFRFCGGPNPNTLVKKAEKKLSLHLQTPRKKDALTGKGASAINDLKRLLEATYDGPKPRFKSDKVDLSKSKQLNQAGLKKLLTQLLVEEKAEAKAKKRPIEEWAAPLATGAGIEQKSVDKLFTHLLVDKKSDKLDLTQFFEQLKLRPSTGKPGGKSKKKKKSSPHSGGPQAYVLTTVKPEHVRDFVSEQILKNMPTNIGNSVKCHPPLKHWGDDERKKKALNTEGYKTTIFLSERTKVKAVVKLAPPETANPMMPTPAVAEPKSAGRIGSAAAASSSAASAPAADPVNHSDILVFAAYRTEYTAMARFESLWHARITMDEDENVKTVEVKEKKNWVDGELDKTGQDVVFEDWLTYVGHEDEFEEMSIPPIA